MNKKRKILTLFTLISFVLIVFGIGYPQQNYHSGFGVSPHYDPMSITWRNGLTPFGTAMSILLVSYIALFAMLADKKPVQYPSEPQTNDEKDAMRAAFVSHWGEAALLNPNGRRWDGTISPQKPLSSVERRQLIDRFKSASSGSKPKPPEPLEQLRAQVADLQRSRESWRRTAHYVALTGYAKLSPDNMVHVYDDEERQYLLEIADAAVDQQELAPWNWRRGSGNGMQV